MRSTLRGRPGSPLVPLCLLLALAPAGAAGQVINGPGGISNDQNAPEIVVDPPSRTITAVTPPMVDRLYIRTCDATGTNMNSVSVTFKGQTYAATYQPYESHSACGADPAVFAVDITATLSAGSNLVTANACDVIGNCGSTSVTYTYVQGTVNAAPRVHVNIPQGASTRDSTHALFVAFNDDRGLQHGTYSITLNGAAVPGIGYNAVTDSAGQASASLRLAPGQNTVVARITDAGGQTATATAILYRDVTKPSITFTPDSVRTTSETLSLAVAFGDDQPLPEGRFWSVWVNDADVTAQMTGGSPSLTGTVTLRLGENTIKAYACDRLGQCTSRTARHVFRYTHNRAAPVISLAPHLGDRRIPSPFEATMTFSTPSYVSRDQPRAVTLVYFEKQAHPVVEVHLEVTDNSADPPTTFSLELLDANGVVLAHTAYGAGNGTTRLAAQFNAEQLATGSYTGTARVTSRWADGATSVTTAPVRVVVVNERNSVFGAGWSIAGLQRIHATTGGVVLTEGDGTAGFFAGPDAAGNFTSPAGDFSTLLWVTPAVHGVAEPYYRRGYPDGSIVHYTPTGLQRLSWDRYRDGITPRRSEVVWNPLPSGVMVPTSITDPAGLTTTLYYWDAGNGGHTGKLAWVRDPSGRQTWFAYDDGANNLTRITTPDEAHTGAALNRMPALSMKYLTYGTWQSSQLKEWTDAAGGQWSYFYQFNEVWGIYAPNSPTVGGVLQPVVRNLTRAELLRLGHSGSLAAPHPRVRADQAWVKTLPLGGDSVSYILDRWNRPMQTRDAEGSLTLTLRDSHGRDTLSVSSIAGPAQWDANGVADSIVVSLGTATRYEWSGGQLLRAIFEKDTAQSYTYGAYAQPTYAYGGGMERRFYLNANALPDSVLEGPPGGLARMTRYTYDHLGRVRTVHTPEGRITTYEYALTGTQNLETVLSPEGMTRLGYDAAGRQIWSTNALGQSDSLRYDVFNRVVSATDPGRARTTFQYNPLFRTGVTDARQQAYAFHPDPVGQDTVTADATRGTIRTWYNAHGLADSTRDALSRVVRYRYDGRQRIIERLADGRRTTYAYDPEDRFTVISNEASTDTLHTVAFVEDPLGSQTEAVTVRPGGRTYRVRNHTRISGGTSGGFGGGGTPYARLETETVLANGTVVAASSRSYDFQGQLVQLGDSVRLDYDAAGRVERLRIGTQDTVRYRYTGGGRLGAIRYSRVALDQALGERYGYDELGRLSQRLSPRGGGWNFRNYGYDAAGQVELSRVAEADTACPEHPVYGARCAPQIVPQYAWAYDAVGNRDPHAHTVENGNRLTRYTAGLVTYVMEYDAAGFLRTKRGTNGSGAVVLDQAFYWNSLGQLDSVYAAGTGMVRFRYDGLGRRIRKEVNGQAIEYVYSGEQIALEVDGATGAKRASYTYLPGVDQPLSMTRGTSSYLYVRDRQGTVRGLLDGATRALVSRYDYDPWGLPQGGTGTVENPFRYNGRELDAETGLYFNRARYYDPQLGRFISPDPIGLDGGINLYAYVGNDPVNQRDPSGLYAEVVQVNHRMTRDEVKRYVEERCAEKNPSQTQWRECVQKGMNAYDRRPDAELRYNSRTGMWSSLTFHDLEAYEANEGWQERALDRHEERESDTRSCGRAWIKLAAVGTWDAVGILTLGSVFVAKTTTQVGVRSGLFLAERFGVVADNDDFGSWWDLVPGVPTVKAIGGVREACDNAQ